MRSTMRGRRTSIRCSWSSELEGALDGAALEAAVQALVRRHASLRAGFRHEGLSRPVQVIVPRARGAVAADRSVGAGRGRSASGGWSGLWRQDRLERFDLGAPPLMRFALIRLAADRHRLVLSNHHLLMDGWSAPVLVRELLTLYARGGDAAALPRVTPYRDYLAFIAGQDRGGGACVLAGGAGRAGGGDAAGAARCGGGAAVAPEQIVLALEAALSAALSGRARGQRADAQHADAGGLGHPAGPADRPRRRGVRGDGGGPAARSLPASSAWWGCSSTRCRCG